VEFHLLGPLEVLSDGEPLALGGAKQRALLAILLLHANEVVSRDRLIDELWGESAPDTASHSLDVRMSRLRKAFEPHEPLVTRSGGYVLEVAPESVDVQRFERLLEEGRQANAAGEHEKALNALESALGLWRGGAFADLAYEAFARTEIERLEELRLVAIEERIEAELALGHHDTLVPELEALTSSHALRERMRGQLMLALYRAGRQAEALRVYGETRKRLVEELGIEPGQALRDLEQAILRQDPALDRPRAAAAAVRSRRIIAGAGALAVAGGIAAAVVLLTQGGTENAAAFPAPDSNAFVHASTGKVFRQATVRDTVATRFDGDTLWSVSSDGELTRIDQQTGKVVATLGLGVTPSGLAVGEGSVWVTDLNSPTLLRIDPSLDPPIVADRLRLPKAGTDQTSDVAVADGSVWVGHGGFNPGAWVERIDPATGRVQHRFSILGGEATALAYGNGALWVASAPAGELRKIDPQTNSIVAKVRLRQGVCCVAGGGGYVWAAVNPDATVWKLSKDGDVLTTIKLPARIDSLTYRDGALWVADGEGGTVIKVDPTTNARRTYAIGHHLAGIDEQKGVIAVGVRPSTQDATAGLKGRIVRIAVKADTLFWSGAPTDPSLSASFDAPQLQFHYATCARLLNYPDAAGEAGKKLVPEVAAELPTVSDGGRTYTFKIRPGYRFSPPSNEPVTAESFRHALERTFSPKYAWFDPSGAVLMGAAAYHAGKTAHIAGLSARGDTLVIRLTKPVPELPRLLALTYACAVPVSTPVVSHGIDAPIPSAGPYYLAAHTDSVAVLKRNPNYHGPRPQRLDAIVYRFGIAPGDAAALIARAKFDYVMEYDPALAPDTPAARGAGSRYRLTPDSTASTKLLAFNTNRPLFKDLRLRRAVEYALDRRALASLDNAIPSTRLLSPRLSGFDAAQMYPLRPDLRKARQLMGGRRAHAVFATFDPSGDPIAARFARAVRQQLAAIGISVTVLPLRNEDWDKGTVATKMARADLSWAGGNSDTGDSVPYLQGLPYVPATESARLTEIAKLSSPRRESEAAALATDLERKALYAVFEEGAVPEFVSRRLGCIVHQPEYAGVDLAALCLANGRD
jgi:DNA-binding SARP family transcriptional activator/ABC-type transport system substrate-binding protein/outer membrane protein assembly factor BamB